MSREFRSYRVEAIVLKHIDSLEADRILTVFTRQRGKLRVRAKGVRKIRSRRAGHLEPFTEVSLQLARSKTLPIVTQAETINLNQVLREDLLSIGYASYIVELLDKFTYEEGENLSLFILLKVTLERLADPDHFPDRLLVIRYYEIRLLDLVGFRPELFTCVLCEEDIEPVDQFFSPDLGGVVCTRSGHSPPHENPNSKKIPISKDALRFLRHFQRSTYAVAARAKPSEQVHHEMETINQYYLSYVLERGLNSPKFIKRVSRPSA